jgi:hypothetical protein
MNLYKIILILLVSINDSYSYNLPISYTNRPIKIINNNNNIKLSLNDDLLINLDNLLDMEMKNNKQLGRIIVEQISSLLPKVDSIGHNILHANNEFINYILEHNLFDDATKKSIILASIRLAQYGDDAGSQILQLYYNMVDKCL